MSWLGDLFTRGRNFVTGGTAESRREEEQAAEVDRLQDDSNRDNRIARTFENLDPDSFSDRVAEKFTERSIERDIEETENLLREIRRNITRSDRGLRPRWFSGAVRKDRLPESDLFTVDTVGTGGIGAFGTEEGFFEIQRRLGWIDALDGQVELVPKVAINAVVFRELIGNNPSQARLDEFNNNTSNFGAVETIIRAGGEVEQVGGLLREVYNTAEMMISGDPNKDALEGFIKEAIYRRMTEGEFGLTVVEGYDTLDSTFEKIQSALFDSDYNVQQAFRSEEENLMQVAVQNFIWLYYTSIVLSGGDLYAIPTAIDDGVANTMFSYSAQLDFSQYVNAFVELIYRSRIHQAIEMVDEEIQALIEAGQSGLVGENGLYSDEAAQWARERLPELLEDLGGAVTRPEDAADRRLAEQCFLIDYLPELARLNQNRAPRYNTFTMIQGRTDTLMSKLLYNTHIQDMDLMTAAELSSLVPKIRIYKVLYNGSLEQREEAARTGNRASLEFYEQEVPFYNHIQQEEIDAMLSPGMQRGMGAGIKSFDWKLEGANPASGRRDIIAELKLYFQSLDELLRPKRFPVPNLPKDDWPEFRYIDLVNIAVAERTPNNEWNPKYYKLRAEVGWAMPSEGIFTGSPEIIARKKRAVEYATKVMYLAANDHSIEITDQGEVNLSINYIPLTEASYSDSDSDILATAETRRNREENRARIAEARAADPCNSETVVSQIREEYAEQVKAENYQAWRRIMNVLLQNGKIFVSRVPTELLDIHRTAGRAASTAGLIEQVFGPRPPAEAYTGVGDLTTASEFENRIESGISAPRSDEETPLLETIQGLSYSSQEDFVNVQYFFFGDLIETALQPVVMGSGDDARGTLEKRLKLMLGPISFKEIIGTGSSTTSQILYNINIADIPISVPYYIEWFLNEVIGENRTTFAALTFIRSLTDKLLRSAMRDQCQGLENVMRQNLQIRSNHITVSGVSDDGSDPFEDPELLTAVNGTRIDVDTTFANKDLGISSGMQTYAPAGSKSYHYMVLYSMKTSVIQRLTGKLEDDDELGPGDRTRGIYHFGIGKDRGIFKSIKFNKTDDPGRREARMQRNETAAATGLVALANNYNISVKTVGNPFFYPGIMIYIDPSGISHELGNPTATDSPSRLLGIGGYHRIFRVGSYIEDGKYETTLEAAWAASGGEETVGLGTPESAGAGACDEAPTAVPVGGS